MKVVYMGTPDFAVPALDSLYNSKHQLLAVVTQTDKPKGRSGKLQFSPVKEYALDKEIPVLQPEKIKGNEEFYKEMSDLAPDVIVVAAYGKILPKQILELPCYGCINIHASLLPEYRGAAPIQWAVIDGKKETGITIMQMDEGIDTGDILKVLRVPLDDKETGGSLFDKLSLLGGPLLLEVMEDIEAGTIQPVAQQHDKHTIAGMLTKKMGELDFSMPAKKLECRIRGCNPWPGTYTSLGGKTLKIWEADVVPGLEDRTPASVIRCDKDNLVIQCGTDALSVTKLQLEGKKSMGISDFLRGYTIEEGTVLGQTV